MIKYLIAGIAFVCMLSACSKKTVVEETVQAPVAPIQAKPSEGKTMVEDRMDQIIARIGLDEKKAMEFKAIEKKYQEKRLALRDEEIDQMAKMQKLRTLMDSMNGEYKDLMSKEEYEAYRAIMDSKLQKTPEY